MLAESSKTLIGKRNFLGSCEQNFSLEYYLTTEEIASLESDISKIYGLCIKKSGVNFDDMEEENLAGLSDNRAQIDFIVDKLIGNSVEPMNVYEVIDDIVDMSYDYL